MSGGLACEELIERCHWMDIGGGLRVRVLDLEVIIEIKERTGREKDLAQLPLLRRAWRERGGPGAGSSG